MYGSYKFADVCVTFYEEMVVFKNQDTQCATMEKQVVKFLCALLQNVKNFTISLSFNVVLVRQLVVF
jgi:hypothetical protein